LLLKILFSSFGKLKPKLMEIVDEACSIRERLFDTNNFKTNPIDFTLPAIPRCSGGTLFRVLLQNGTVHRTAPARGK
jgi:hypothetical protein